MAAAAIRRRARRGGPGGTPRCWRRRPLPRRIPSQARPRSVLSDAVGTAFAVAGGRRAVDAARDALPHPVHAAFVTVAHGRLEAPMDRIGLLAAMGLWPNGVLPGPPGSTFAGFDPREAWVASCRTVAGSPRCRALRGCRRAGGRRRPRYASCHMHLPRCHAPEPRTGASVQASVRVPLMRTRTGRSDIAARRGAGLLKGRIIGEDGGVWQRLGGGAGGDCANAAVPSGWRRWLRTTGRL